MRRTLIALALILALPAGTALAQTLGAVLTSSQEVPPCSASGFGNATITFDSTRSNINVTITVSNLGSPITASHIHAGAAGTAGGPRCDCGSASKTSSSGSAERRQLQVEVREAQRAGPRPNVVMFLELRFPVRVQRFARALAKCN